MQSLSYKFYNHRLLCSLALLAEPAFKESVGKFKGRLCRIHLHKVPLTPLTM